MKQKSLVNTGVFLICGALGGFCWWVFEEVGWGIFSVNWFWILIGVMSLFAFIGQLTKDSGR